MNVPRSLLVLFVALLLAVLWFVGRDPGGAVEGVAPERRTGPPADEAPALAPVEEDATRATEASAPTLDPEAVRKTRVEVVVVDHDGRGLSGVTVRVATPGRWGTWRDLREGVTDEDGVAAFGDYAREGLWADVVPETLPAGHFPAARVFGSLVSSDEARLVVVCPASARIEGRVTAADGTPVPGHRVQLIAADFDADTIFVDTDADASFVVDPAHPGTWMATVLPRDRRALAGRSLPLPLLFAAAPGRVTRVDIALPRAGTRILGRVLTTAGDPVPGALVRAGAVQPGAKGGLVLRGPGRAFAITDESGRYTLGPLPEGKYAVRVGDRHGSDHVTRDDVLFVEWPDDFVARAGDGREYVTEVELVERTIEWAVRPEVSTSLARAHGAEPGDVQGKVGWCRLHLDGGGAWRFVSARRDEPLLIVVGLGDAEWRVELEEPAGDAVERTLALPPR